MEGPTKTGKGSQLLDLMRNAISARQYRHWAEQIDIAWIGRFNLFHGNRHPQSMGPQVIRDVLTDLPIRHDITASTRIQTFGRALSSPLDGSDEPMKRAA
ncbi:MAG: hypothetical protein ACI8W7_005157 [Gammaproteobacteria bacterium]|jgi:hypothetical protein